MNTTRLQRLEAAVGALTPDAIEWEALIRETVRPLPEEMKPAALRRMRAVPRGDRTALLAACLEALPDDFRRGVIRELSDLTLTELIQADEAARERCLR